MSLIPPALEILELQTDRMVLEPITEAHAQELLELFSDERLHTFVPFVVPTPQQQQERCARWAKRISREGDEIYLNWAARHRESKKIIGHFQSGYKSLSTASIGYVLAKDFQGQGLAFEALKEILRFLGVTLKIREVRAWSDTRNVASHRLAARLGMKQVEFIKDADFFKGATSDEYVFAINLNEEPTSTKMIPVRGGKISATSVGKGHPIIFLHGGPGDTHDYMKRMAEPLFQDFQCIFFDQRGTGGSNNFERRPELFGVEHLFDDLKAVQEYFQADNAMLVGHSWGAMYALYACLQYPGRFKKAALLNMGPIDAEMEKATSEHLISVLDDAEKAKWKNLRRERNQARDEGNFDRAEALDKVLMPLRLKSWIFNPNLREAFLKEYFQDPPPDREVNKLIWEAQHGWFSWEQLNDLQTPTWVCVGANDFLPVAQAQRIAEIAPNARLTVYEKCGHIPWLEHSERFYGELKQFFGSCT